MTALTDLKSSGDLIRNLTQREIKGKYKRTALGQVWSLVNPIALMFTYSIVFGTIMRGNRPLPGDPSGLDYFFLWLSCGLLPWIFVLNVLMSGMGSIVGNANLIQKVYFPREALVLSNSLALLFTFCFEMTVLVVATFLFGGEPFLFLPVTIVLMGLLFLFATGIAFFLAVANVFFRDTQHFVAILLNLLFYAAPIVYSITLAQAHRAEHPILVGVIEWNPITKFAEAFRNTIYDGRMPAVETLGYIITVSVILFVAGYMFFRRHTARMAEEL
ncbi:ABC-2 type transport system permease protein [Jatrophihabitans sp. GAS493]|uniref:ABC transporter permease n=1 Tax=Jatrophihabitans sp. GAS493 TaxID=1907575 RepID=UPI000BB6865A|nr:ABC transporter permease [Jatrophihabitans sp. GAS493]SOD70603.1 ABC-2 type transport system permease protein [Jatrophihabitans sp. GAS493]